MGSAVSLSVESSWQHASADQRAPLLLPHEWLMFSVFSGFFFVCVLCGSRISTVYYSPGRSNSSFICIDKGSETLHIFFKQLLYVMRNHKDLTD